MRDGVAKCFLRFANGDSNGNSEAALARAAKRAVADDLRREFHIRIGQDDDVILCAALALHALAAGGGTCVNMLGNRSGADKTNGAYLRMIAERVDHLFPAVDEVYDTFGQTGLLQKLEGAIHGEGNALRWFQDEGISARNGIREEPVRNHRWKVKRHDGGDDSQRLADLHFVDAGRHVFEIVTLHHHGNAASNFHVFDGAAQFCSGFGEGLAIFESDDAGKFVKILFEEIFQLEEILDAFAGRSAAREGIGGGLNGSVDIRGGREGGACEQFGSSGIGDVKVFGRGGSAPGAIHVVLEIGYLGGDGTAHTQLLGPCVGGM